MNNILLAISKNKETYKKFRIYLFNNLDTTEVDKEKRIQKVLTFEKTAKFFICLPYLINFIEEEYEIDFVDCLSYFKFKRPSIKFNKLLNITIIGVFNKCEQNDFNYFPF